MSTKEKPDSTALPDTQETLIELLSQGSPVYFKAGGYSMTPTIYNGEKVRVRPLHPADIRRGAILLYRINNRLVLHRLIRQNRKSELLHFIGDAALRGEDLIHERDLVGTAACVYRKGRTLPLNTFLSRLTGLLRYGLRPLLRELLKWRKKT